MSESSGPYETNPYESPRADISPVTPLVVRGMLTNTMVFYLKGAAPWLRFIGIVGFAVSFILVAAALAVLFGLGSVMPLPDFMVNGGSAVVAVVAAYLIPIVALTFVPSLFAYRFGRGIRRYLTSAAEAELERAFKSNKSLWKFLGIAAIVYSAFILIFIFGVALAALGSLL